MDKEKKSNEMKSEPLIHSLDGKPKKRASSDTLSGRIVAIVIVLSLALGLGSGYLGALLTGGGGSGSSKATSTSEKNGSESSDSETQAGVNDPKIYKDTAEGVLKEGGIEGEGEFHLERPGGESQNVYLTSTTVDLSKFLEKKVKVRGQTYSAQVAGWLMEVGFLEVVE